MRSAILVPVVAATVALASAGTAAASGLNLLAGVSTGDLNHAASYGFVLEASYEFPVSRVVAVAPVVAWHRIPSDDRLDAVFPAIYSVGDIEADPTHVIETSATLLLGLVRDSALRLRLEVGGGVGVVTTGDLRYTMGGLDGSSSRRRQAGETRTSPMFRMGMRGEMPPLARLHPVASAAVTLIDGVDDESLGVSSGLFRFALGLRF